MIIGKMDNIAFEKLIINDEGFAQRNLINRETHVGFASFLLIFYPDTFYVFVRNIERNYLLRSADKVYCREKNIVVPTPLKEVSLLLCLNEMESFVHFLQKTETVLIAKGLTRDVLSRINKNSMN